MSREIKFRIWDGAKYWYNVAPLNCNKALTQELSDHECCFEYDNQYISREGSVEQFTGLVDKNGTEIYEGDIVSEVIDVGSPCSPLICKYIVEWNEELFLFGLIDLKETGVHDELWETNSSVEVIGNIHENRL